LYIKQYDWKPNKFGMVAVIIGSVYLATRLFSV
jgi:hypothetical protein